MCEEKANTAEPQMGFGAEFDFKVLKDSLQVSYRACDDQNGYQIFTDAFQFTGPLVDPLRPSVLWV